MNKKISEISQRAKFIFKVLVENYLTTGQPMGSKSISSKLNYELSPATIRNVLNEIIKQAGKIKSTMSWSKRLTQ